MQPCPDPGLSPDDASDAETGTSRRKVIVLGAAAALAVPVAASGGTAAAAAVSEDQDASAVAPTPLIRLAALKVGRSVRVGAIILTRTGATTVVGRSAVCTHRGCTVAPNGAELKCPCHGSRFHPRTGAVLHGPAARPLPAVRLLIKNGIVYRA